MPSGVYKLPPLPSMCPQKSGNNISPAFQEANTTYEQWVRANIFHFASMAIFKGLSLSALVRVLATTEVPLLAALAWPKANSKELRGILDYMTMSIMLEELTDQCSREAAEGYCKLWISVLNNPEAGRGHSHPFIKLMTHQLVVRLKDAVDPYHWPALMESNVEFAKNVAQEAVIREASGGISATHCIASYMDMRRETIGTRPCFVLMQSTRRLYLPKHVLQHPIVAEMENLALDMVYIANDIYSFKKELGERGVNNLFTVMEKDPTTQHLDLQARLDHSGKLFQAAADRFNACKCALPGFDDEETDRQVASLVDGLVDWVSGNIEWSIRNHRYNVFRNEDDKRDHILRLDDHWLASGKFKLLFLLSIIVAYISFSMMM